MDCRPLIVPLYVWDTEKHELLGVQQPGQWLSEMGIPLDRPLGFSSSPYSCGCEACG